MAFNVNARYALSHDVFACKTGRYVIFLDLQRDRYLSVSTERLLKAGTSVMGLDSIDGCYCEGEAVRAQDNTPVLRELLAAGLLRLATPEDNLKRIHALPTPNRDLSSTGAFPKGPGNGRFALLRATKALLHAHLILHLKPLASIVALRSQSRRSREGYRGEGAIERSVDLSHTFARYRPLFPRDYLCLFDSLALLLFLSMYDIYPNWVFGVREEPFAAHCWVQTASVVLNDYCDRVSCYRPIMTV